MGIGLPLAFIALTGLWALLRISIFLGDRIESISVHPDLYSISTWVLRIILLGIAGYGLYLSIPGILLVFALSNAYGGIQSYLACASLISITIYTISALIMNFPFFPLSLHKKLFYPIHIVLLPCLAVVPYVGAFFIFFGLLFVYSLLWRMCLSDRIKYCQPRFP